MPMEFFDPMPEVHVTFDTPEGPKTIMLFSYYPDEINFKPEEFIGLTVEEAVHLKFKKDKEFLQS
jgi:hypothetical protein